MSYEPTEWQNGDTITSAKLNNIEDGVSEVNSEYTPTNWQNGDVITADKLNNIEQGIVNAAGGEIGIVTCIIHVNNTSQIPDLYLGGIDYIAQYSIVACNIVAILNTGTTTPTFSLPDICNLWYLPIVGSILSTPTVVINSGNNSFSVVYNNGIEITKLNDDTKQIEITVTI